MILLLQSSTKILIYYILNIILRTHCFRSRSKKRSSRRSRSPQSGKKKRSRSRSGGHKKKSRRSRSSSSSSSSGSSRSRSRDRSRLPFNFKTHACPMLKLIQLFYNNVQKYICIIFQPLWITKSNILWKKLYFNKDEKFSKVLKTTN